MKFVDILGLLAGLLCTLSFIPQVIKIYAAKKADDISLITFSVFSAGIILWLCYGIALHNIPIIWANSATIVLSSSIVVMKLVYSRRKQ